MSRINTNVSSLIAQRVLGKNNDSLNLSLERLSTGLKINTGKDNPAGLIASENLRAEKAGITQAIDNASRASNIVGTAEGGLSEVSSLLTELQSLVSATANTGGLSQEEIDHLAQRLLPQRGAGLGGPLVGDVRQRHVHALDLCAREGRVDRRAPARQL